MAPGIFNCRPPESFRYLLILCLTAISGCGGCRGCGIAANSSQGLRLKELLAADRRIVPEAPVGVPITFGEIKVESRGTGENEILYCSMPWEVTAQLLLTSA